MLGTCDGGYLQEWYGKLQLCEKGKWGNEFNFAVLPKMESQGLFRTRFKNQLSQWKGYYYIQERLDRSLIHQRRNDAIKKYSLEGHCTAAAFNFILNDTKHAMFSAAPEARMIAHHLIAQFFHWLPPFPSS